MSTKCRPECHYHGPFANLAAAIIRSGELQHDTRFLESDWCDILKEICRLDDQMYGNRNDGVRGQIRLSTSRGAIKDEHN